MAEAIGYILGPFILSFLIVYFGLRKAYLKKHNSPMSTGGIILRVVIIGLIFLGISVLGSVS